MTTLENSLRLAKQRQLGIIRTRVFAVGIFLFFLSLVCPFPLHSAQPQHEIKLATMAPENSSLMKIFREMNTELLQETEGRVGFKLFSGFALGDERDVFRKLRIGLIHAAAFSSTFLNTINPELRTLQIPFLFNNYQEVDYVLDKMVSDFDESFSRRGYQILGWSEIGFIYVMTTVPVTKVEDWKGKKVWSTTNAPMANAVFAKAKVSPVNVGAPDVLVALQTNLLEAVYNSPYYALVTQWYTRIKYITDVPLSYVGIGLIMSNKTFSRLSPQDKETTIRVCRKYLRLLTEKTRKDNQQALELMLKRGVKKIAIDPNELNRFKELLDQAMADVDPKVLPRDTLKKVTKTLDEYRASKGETK
ncbi:MAG: TRAP transporter substrate-binding protein DctP [Deltaproteobacteria bacterium]|nr:TRAP transporter substrate-binding protein DctP [Deltaproteobacteria bacterium]